MKLAINLRTRAAALFAMLFLCFGMIGGFTGMANQEGAWSEPLSERIYHTDSGYDSIQYSF